MGPHEPYWRTNTSFSPPLSRRWERRFQNDGLPYGPQGGLQIYESSPSSKDSDTSARDDHLPNHIVSDGPGSYFSSPVDSFQTQQWTPSPMKDVTIDNYVSGTSKGPVSGPLLRTPSMEGTSVNPYNTGSISSRSDGSDYETVVKSSTRNFSNRYSFKSKPIHPISSLNHTPEAGSSTPRRETFRWSSGSSMDFTDVSEQLDSDSVSPYTRSDGLKCGLCDRFLSQRSPWSSRRIVRSGDMPVTGILSCRHVFHADCLDQTTPKIQKHDPPCPVCARLDNVSEQPTPSSSRLKIGAWSCGQVADCVDGALHASPRNSMMLLNRNRLKKHLSFKGNSGKLKKNEGFEFSSKLTVGPTMLKR
ncbi:hypothetical protein ACHQM5_006332 [Ranunculus cassubicifolius]